MATRLQSDDPGKQANWADIDDDDDDWAPETIEWTDGTKITLPQAEDPPIPAPESTPTPTSILKQMLVTENAKPKSPTPMEVAASPTVKASGLGSGKVGLVLKGASEKPTLVAKPPGPPTPVKSPWASLPPVDKAALVAAEATQQPQQSQQSRFSQRDPHGFHGMPPPPAKEIAADDFSRSWREGSNTSRELYNSQSGRYEPVNDKRRGSMRNDVRSHQPAVLQRPMAHDGPAEPSAAFQTYRANGQEGGYGRRRTSSNVSGGSGNIIRRMSRGQDMPPPHEMLNPRRGSLAAVSDAPSSPRNFSPSGQHPAHRGQSTQQLQPHSRGSPVVSHPSPQSAHEQTVPPPTTSADQQNSAPPVQYEDPIEEQKKIMRATRELAIKRRNEQQALEEAATKERIRLRLEAMGPPPENKKRNEVAKSDLTAPSKAQGPAAAPTSSAPPKQSGSESGTEPKVKEVEAADQPLSLDASEVKTIEEPLPKEHLQTNGAQPSRSMAHQASQDNRSSNSWQNNSATASNRIKSWSAAPTPQSTSVNVWGPPSNDRTLGNGTFNPELSRLPDMHQANHPGPIGPPNPNRGSTQNQQGRGQNPYSARPAPIGPPPRQQGASREEQANRAAVAKSGWGSLPDRIAQEDAISSQERDLELARMRDLKEKGLLSESAGPVINETWRKVVINEDGTRSKVQGNIATVHDPSQTRAAYPDRSHEEITTRSIFEDQEMTRRRYPEPVGGQPLFTDSWKPQAGTNVALPVRGSRFFPNNRDVRLEEQSAQMSRPASPSPPPPTMAGHPAYDGDVAHPHVSLPRPSPVVRLPPVPILAPIGPPKPVSFAAAVQASAPPPTIPNAGLPSPRNAQAYQDIRRQDNTAGGWQDRINSLIGRKNSPPKSYALAVDSSSKHALELVSQQRAATVSLPSLNLVELAGDNGSLESKPAAEECFEEQEMGSLPVIKVPNFAPAAGWVLAPPQPKLLPRKFQVSQILSVEALQFPQHIAHNNGTIVIKVPGQEESKSVTIPVARQRSNPRRNGARGGPSPRNPSLSHSRGGRGRDSGGFASPGHDVASVSSGPNTASRGGRGARGYGTSWGRHASTPVHT